MSNSKINNNTTRTTFWTKKSMTVAFKRSVQALLNPQLKPKVIANTECESGCNSSCGTACGTGCTDF